MKSSGKIFGIGLSKTGTTSLSKALNQLGIRSIHWPNDPLTFRELAAGKFRLTILNEYDAILDNPIPAFYAQFDKVYPGSKFILTVREVDSWLESAQFKFSDGLVDASSEGEHLGPLTFRKYCRAVVYGTLEYNEDRYRQAFTSHLRDVKKYFEDRPSDLLVMDVCGGDGWEQLCPFLDMEIPARDFPHEDSWNSRLRKALRELKTLVPRESPFIMAGKLYDLKDRFWERTTPFTQKDGQYWGPPVDSAKAISELERLRSNSGEYFVLGFPDFWWLDHYGVFGQYMKSRFPCLVENSHLLVFDLRKLS